MTLNRGMFAVTLLFLSAVMITGCKKNVAPLQASTAPTTVIPAPTAQISATPDVVTAGNPVVLKWNSTNATSASIEGIGTVASAGSKTVTPSYSSSYTLEVKGTGGSSEATVRVTVNPARAAAPAFSESDEQAFEANVKDVFFDYDKYSVRSDEQAVIQRDAAYLAKHPYVKIVIGGYCDDRGSEEYNLSLGESRAESTKKALIAAGVDPSRIRVISYGKEKQFCSQETEQCWQENRRGGFAMNR